MRRKEKWQVTISYRIRKILGLTSASEINFAEENNSFTIVESAGREPTRKIKNLRGIATVQLSTDEILSLTRGKA